MCVVAEISVGPVVLPAGMGSFDFVRLAPHFAQEDRHLLVNRDDRDLLVNKISVCPPARASTVTYWLFYGWMLEAHSARIPAVWLPAYASRRRCSGVRDMIVGCHKHEAGFFRISRQQPGVLIQRET